MQIELTRDQWHKFTMNENGWITAVSRHSKAQTEFWLRSGDWFGREIWDHIKREWKVTVIRGRQA